MCELRATALRLRFSSERRVVNFEAFGLKDSQICRDPVTKLYLGIFESKCQVLYLQLRSVLAPS